MVLPTDIPSKPHSGTSDTSGTSQSGSRAVRPGSPPEGASVRSPVTRSLCVFTPYGVQV